MDWWGVMEARMVVITTITVATITITTTTITITTFTVPSTQTQTQHGTTPAMVDTPTAPRSDNPTRAAHTITRPRSPQRPGTLFSIHQPQELLVRVFHEKER